MFLNVKRDGDAVRSILPAMWMSLLSLGSVPVTAHADHEIRIGVLAHREESVKMWAPTADYLSQKIPHHRFRVVALDNHTIDPAVRNREVEFVLTNPGSYVELESRHGMTRILTLRNLRQGKPYTQFGSVIFTRADHPQVKTLQDLRGHAFMAVDRNAFGGFLMAWRELKYHGIDPFSDFRDLNFVGLPQERIVFAVRDGKVDAGTVRTDTLERMAAGGKIRLEQFRVLNSQQVTGFPFALSTQLYPEWPFARVRHTSNKVAQDVVIALLSLPADHPAALASKSAGWTVPLDYTPVHDLYRELRVGPYEHFGMLTTADVVRNYWHWIAIVAAAFGALMVIALYILRLNRILFQSQTQLLLATRELESANLRLERLSTMDNLTGIPNHRSFEEQLDREWRRARRDQKPLALLMVDVDYFKKFNDAFGHLAGDDCLRQVAQCLQVSLKRAGDIVARYGGEEFAVILPSTEHPAVLAERLRTAVMELGLGHPNSTVGKIVTVSIGVGSLVPVDHLKPADLIARADRALYRAKESGRNRVVVDESRRAVVVAPSKDPN